MIYKKSLNYLYPDTLLINELDEKISFIPLVIDTEFVEKQLYNLGNGRLGLTLQVKSINDEKGIIFSHQDLYNWCQDNNRNVRHKTSFSDFVVIDYLREKGYDFKLVKRDCVVKKYKGETLPVIQFDIYSHFSLAELLMIFNGEMKDYIINLITKGVNKGFDFKRRLTTFTRINDSRVIDTIEIPFHILFNDKKYRIKLRIIDTVALHGVASYKSLCETCGIVLKYKHKIEESDLNDMLTTYFEKPIDFDNYALGDLEVYEILVKNSQLFETIYQDLGITDYFQTPKLSIGNSVNDLFQSVLFKHFNIDSQDKDSQEKLIDLCFYGSSKYLKKHIYTTACLLSKVFGGRCRNNRPLTHNLDGVLVDIDISSAYGNGLRNQQFPIGKPIVEDFLNSSKINNYLTLRQWLKHRKYNTKNCEIIPGLWSATVSNKYDHKTDSYDLLEYDQDVLISWFNFKYDDLGNDNYNEFDENNEVDTKTGVVKIFNNQIINGVITNDFLQWLFNVCSTKQKNELLDKLYVIASIYYPTYSKVSNLDELIAYTEYFENNGEKNTTISFQHKLKNGKIVKTINEPSYWLSINLGELIVDKLLAYRKFYQIKNGKESSLDILFKLCTNTLYGVFCSPYFDVSNTIVGNNITSRCRFMSWYMEKGFYSVQTITDGGVFDLNQVVFPRKKQKVNGSMVTNLYRLTDREKSRINMIDLKPLDNCNAIELSYIDDKPVLKLIKNGSEIIVENSFQWLNETCLKHLQSLFKVDILHQETSELIIDCNGDKPFISYNTRLGLFSFEVKNIYEKGVFHGTSNYYLVNPNSETLKMRSYEKNKKHIGLELSVNNEIIEIDFFDISPSKTFLVQLSKPDHINRSKVFKKKAILKLNDFRNNFQKWLNLDIYCGDTYYKIGLLRELSLSQFTFVSMSQYIAIEKEMTRNKRNYNQSYEGYFLNDDNSLNYDFMMSTLDSLISLGLDSLNDILDKNCHRNRDLNIIHPENEVLTICQEKGVLTFNDDIIDVIDLDDYSYENGVIFDGFIEI